jgi:predicted nucleotidyltransferase
MELSRIKSIITDQFREQQGVVAVLIYGSHAKGVARPDSDVDIAVLYDPPHVPSPLELWEFRQILDRAFPCEIDLICLNNADPIIGNQIYKHHQVILMNDSKQLAEYFARLSSEYAELKEFIKPMEDQILQRKYYVRSGSDYKKNR